MRRALVLFAVIAALGCKRHHSSGRAHATPIVEKSSVATELRDKATKSTRAFDIVRSLTDEVGPRMSGTPGDAKAVEWGLAKMKELGLQNVRTERVMVPHWERGAASAAIVGSERALHLAALGGSVATPNGGLEAEVISVPSIEALNELPIEKVTGKIVFFDKPMARTKDGAGYGKAVDVRGKGPIAAAKRGAVAVLIRSVGTGSARLPHTGATRYLDDVPKIPAAALAIPDAEVLRRALERGPVKLKLTLGCTQLEDAPSANVVGEVVGSERPDEIVLIGAHLDSWDLGDGAIDDGAGVAVVLETARMIAELPRRPRRTVRVVLANEESGLRGAKEYAKLHGDELAKHMIALESDLGAGKVFGLSYLAGPNAGPSIKAIAAPLAAIGVASPSPAEHHGADLWPLRGAGVPVVDLHQDATKYFDLHHTADDTLDKIDAAELAQVVAATATFTFGAADADSDFGRIPDDKRK
jgi:carboxypeptidase Q